MWWGVNDFSGVAKVINLDCKVVLASHLHRIAAFIAILWISAVNALIYLQLAEYMDNAYISHTNVLIIPTTLRAYISIFENFFVKSVCR